MNEEQIGIEKMRACHSPSSRMREKKIKRDIQRSNGNRRMT